MAQVINFNIDQGSTWSANVKAYTSNSSGFPVSANLYQYADGAGQLRTSYYANNHTANIAVDIHPVNPHWNIPGLDANNQGHIELSMNSHVTGSIAGGRYVYDVEILGGPAVTGYSSGNEYNNILRICEGTIKISPQVTKWDWWPPESQDVDED